jgi:hypothetical protein
LPGDATDKLIAAGFLRLGIYEYNQRDARGHWNDIMNEMTDTVGDVFLGMSVACARCHDHKFDDIQQKDYFKLRAFFEPVIWRDDLKAATDAQHVSYEQQLTVWEEATEPIRKEIDALLKPYHDGKWIFTVDKFPFDIQACFKKSEAKRTSWDHQMAYLVSRQFEEEAGGPLKDIKKDDEAKYEDLKKALAAYDHLKPAPLPAAMTVSTFEGERSPTLIPDKNSRSPVGRKDLAEWIGDPNNPLTTRVIVNRIWQQHFGEGLVATANDFGRKGSAPSHPELLDWLANEFVNQGWSFKQLHRLILSSATWQQSSHHPHADEYQAMDPEEKLLWRAPVRRLSAEAIRDSMLLLSGELMGQVGGPSVGEDVPRRSLYVKRFRNANDTFLHAFDVAPGLKSVAMRNNTTTPTQSLTMINGDYPLERAKKWATRLLEDSDLEPTGLLQRAMRSAWGREATAEELQKALHFLDQGLDPDKVADICHVFLNSNEFLYVN